MSRNPKPGTAKIIPFPLKNRRFASAAAPEPAPAKPPRAIEWGSSWYHQCAIEEAARDRKP